MQLTTGAGDTPGSTRWSPDGASIVFARAGQLMRLTRRRDQPRATGDHEARDRRVLADMVARRDAGSTSSPRDAPTADERERERRKDDVYAFDENVKARQLWSVAVASGAETAITSGPLSVLSYRLSRDGSLLVVGRASHAARGRQAPRRAVGDGRRRRQRPRGHAQRHRGSPARAVARQHAGSCSSPRRTRSSSRTTTRTCSSMPAAGGTPKPVLPDFPVRDRPGRLVARRRVDPGGRQHGRAQRDHPDRRSHAAVRSRSRTATTPSRQRGASCRRPARWCSSSTSRRGSATCGRWRFRPRAPPRRPLPCASPGRSTRSIGRSRCRARRRWRGRAPTAPRSKACSSIPTDYAAGRRYPLVVQMHGGPDDSDKFGAGPGLLLSYFPVLTGTGLRRAPAELPRQHRLRQRLPSRRRRRLLPEHAPRRHDRRRRPDQARHRRSRSARRDGLERRRPPDEQARHDDRLASRPPRPAPASANWMSMYAQSDVARVPHAVVRRHAVAEERADRRVLEPLAAQGRREREDADAVLRRRERRRACRWRSRSRCTGRSRANGVPTHLYVAPREGHQWAELRHQIFKANTELAWFARYALGGASYVPEQAPAETPR